MGGLEMRAGWARAEITPTQPGITLSGFASRRNQPSEGIDDPLWVNALAVEEAGECVLVLVFDLLGLGSEITDLIQHSLDAAIGIPRRNRILCCTHTHSAPATVRLIGCGIEDPSYWRIVVRGALEAARSAVENMRPARLRYATVGVKNLSYNRRKLLRGGRVTMTQFPDEPVLKEGPVWDRFFLARFEDESDRGICGIAHWAAHACTVGAMRVSADYPGRLRELLADYYGLPFIFLQGACGNINPPLGDMTRDRMLRNADSLVREVVGAGFDQPVDTQPFFLADSKLRLSYGPIPSPEELRRIREGMSVIAETGSGPQEAVALLADILNTRPGDQPDPDALRHTASLVREWAEGLLAPDAPDAAADGCDLSVAVWRVGPIAFCFVAAEVFVETAVALQEAFPDLIVNAVGYASPLVGYLPTDEALDEGGYESACAFMFYGRPAPFAKGSEPAVSAALRSLMGA